MLVRNEVSTIMRSAFKVAVLIIVFGLIASSNRSVASQDNNSLSDILRQQDQMSTFVSLMESAELDTMLRNPGNFTIIAPTNAAFERLSAEQFAELQENANKRREVMLYHVVQGRYGSGEIRSWGEGEMVTALGNNVTTQGHATVTINHTAQMIRTDLEASNGVIHFLDAVLDPNSIPVPATPAPPANNGGQPSAEGGAWPEGGAEGQPDAPPTAVPTPTIVPTATKPPWWVDPAEPSNDVVAQPNDNPAFIDGGYVEYNNGVMADSSFCKGMTWVVLNQYNGVVRIGADRKTNPYRGDAGCEQRHSMLCMKQDFRGAPGAEYLEGWSGAVVEATEPIPGTRLHSQDAADSICKNTFGHEYRMAEFHDGNAGVDVGEFSGWDFWAYGGLEPGHRFWVRINDQPANPWDSEQPMQPIALNTWVQQVLWSGGDPAFVGNGGHLMPQEALQAVRDKCMGTTFVVHRQQDGMVQVGADRITNPYRGDTNCDQRLPVLCIRVDGHRPPPNTNGYNYASGWSGGELQITFPFAGNAVNTREKMNQTCRSAFGSGWRPAEFHDGALGTSGTDGWKIWAFGGLNVGRRMWISVNDQPANPWNPHQ